MSKKPSLAVALKAASNSRVSEIKINQPGETPAPVLAQTKAKSRVGKKAVAGYFDAAVIRQLKQLALDEDSNIQELLGEALNDLFIKRNMKPIA